jgi:5,10-methylenetetrahydromethanopterin reductase
MGRVAFTDSQNLVGDPFVAAALASRVTERLRLGTGVTNAATRDPAARSTGAGLDERDGAVVAEVGRTYDSNMHLVNHAPHTAALAPDFVDRFAVVGDPDECVRRLQELAALDLSRFVLTGAAFGADRGGAKGATELVVQEVLPALKAR